MAMVLAPRETPPFAALHVAVNRSCTGELLVAYSSVAQVLLGLEQWSSKRGASQQAGASEHAAGPGPQRALNCVPGGPGSTFTARMCFPRCDTQGSSRAVL